MQRLAYLAATTALSIAAPAVAGDAVLYGAAPQWVDSAEANIDRKAKTPLVLFDVQQRIASGALATYIDQAFLLSSPQSLTQAGTTAAQWMPDHGDLTVHKVEILREGETIDVLAGGARYTVLRRETNLERRMLDGSLTATMAIPGLRIGDILRVAYSVTQRDPVLGGNVQALLPLMSAPVSAGFARAQLSWPTSEKIQWRAGPRADGAKVETVGADQRVTLMLPLAKADTMPSDAPGRFNRPALLQAGTFASWEDVSRLFAPLYATTNTIEAGSTLEQEVDRIAAASSDPRHRAALATRFVQDKIGYLLNGMNGGNYAPQSPKLTWDTRSGDCKAKTLLLLAMLDKLGIAAEPVLVSSEHSDSVGAMLPMPGVFDHVFVRATIDGQSYWLDGTASGTRPANVADTPPFRTVLPVAAKGAGLMALAPRTPAQPVSAVKMTIDQRAGVDVPALITVKAHLTGPMAGQLSAMHKQASPEQIEMMGEGFASSVASGVSLTAIDMRFDDDAGSADIDFTGIATSGWRADGAQVRRTLSELDSSDVSFSPNRARASWRDIPVELGDPENMIVELKVLLPEQTPGFALTGTEELDVTYAGRRITRRAGIDRNIVTVTETFASPGGELPPAEIAAEKLKAARIAGSTPAITASAEAERLWQYGRPELRKRLAPIEAAYATAIARDPEEANGYLNRARFRDGVFDFRGAIADFDKAIALDPETNYYEERAGAHYAMGQFDAAIADYRRSYEMAPSVQTAMTLATILGENGAAEEALALLGEYDTGGEDHAGLVETRASILAYSGRGDEGHAELQALIAEKPGQGSLLNADCWFRARFNIAADTMRAACGGAVEKSAMPAAALDSRALALIRLGDMAGAKADAEAALALQPGQYVTRYLLAHANRALGDPKAGEFISYFQRTWPGLTKIYAGYGVKP